MNGVFETDITMKKLIFTLAMLLFFGCHAVQAELPSRTDCIVGSNFDWHPNVSNSQKLAILEEMMRAIVSNQIPYLAAVRYEGTDAIFAIFDQNCDSKDESFLDLLKLLQEQIKAAPAFKVISKRIEPSPATILTFGPSWRDGQNTSLDVNRQ
jgi:hypothetical protein